MTTVEDFKNTFKTKLEMRKKQWEQKAEELEGLFINTADLDRDYQILMAKQKMTKQIIYDSHIKCLETTIALLEVEIAEYDQRGINAQVEDYSDI
jgi:hypothetical protein